MKKALTPPLSSKHPEYMISIFRYIFVIPQVWLQTQDDVKVQPHCLQRRSGSAADCLWRLTSRASTLSRKNMILKIKQKQPSSVEVRDTSAGQSSVCRDTLTNEINVSVFGRLDAGRPPDGWRCCSEADSDEQWCECCDVHLLRLSAADTRSVRLQMSDLKEAQPNNQTKC